MADDQVQLEEEEEEEDSSVMCSDEEVRETGEGRTSSVYVFVCDEQQMKDHLASPEAQRRASGEDKKVKQVAYSVAN